MGYNANNRKKYAHKSESFQPFYCVGIENSITTHFFKTLVRKIKKGRKKDKGNKIEKNLKRFIKSCN